MSRRSVDRRHRDDHDRLGYHPDCPTCREDRLSGLLSPRPVVGRRASAIFATGVLALSAGGTATSIASEPDDQREGVSVPRELTPRDPGAPAAPPTADPNRGDDAGAPRDEGDADSDAETALPFQVGPGVGDRPGADEDAPPVETEPTEDPDAALPLSEPAPPPTPETHDGAVPPTTLPAPVVPAPVVLAPAPESQLPAPPVEQAPAVEPPVEQAPAVEPEGEQGKHQRARRPNRKPRKSPAPQPTQIATPQPTQVAAAQAVPPAPSSTDDTETPLTDLGRFHIVRRGESLWLIASVLLGPGASDADIALEVKRLWRLNAKRIGTGDPNLLIVGVRLRLR